jgi:hypothetical protein
LIVLDLFMTRNDEQRLQNHVHASNTKEYTVFNFSKL